MQSSTANKSADVVIGELSCAETVDRFTEEEGSCVGHEAGDGSLGVESAEHRDGLAPG